MNPRRLHSDTIFSIKGVSFGSAMRRAVFLKHRLMSREARNSTGTVRWGKAFREQFPKEKCQRSTLRYPPNSWYYIRKIFAFFVLGRYSALPLIRKRNPKQTAVHKPLEGAT